MLAILRRFIPAFC